MDTQLKLGIVGCAEGTHGKAWAQILSTPEGQRFGMRVARVWDESRSEAEALAGETSALCVHDWREAGQDVDGILITEQFPDRYLQLGRPFLEAGRRIFFNRPFAGSVADARAIFSLARKHGASVYSASALFHTAAGKKARDSLAARGPLRLFNVTGPSDHIFYYLPHAIACLVSVVGTGICAVRSLSLPTTPGAPHLATKPVVVYAEYAAESVAGAARGVIEMTGPATQWYGFRLKLYGAEDEMEEVRFEVSYDLLLETMTRFFRNGVEPVPETVILEQTAVFYAALRSAQLGGATVTLADFLGG